MHDDNQGRRVLFLVNHLGDSGITSHIMTLAQGMTAQGWAVGLVTAEFEATQAKGSHWLEDRGIQHFHVPLPNVLRLAMTPRTVRATLKALKRLKEVVRQFKPDVLHVHGLGMTLYVAYLRRTCKVPLVSTCHITPNLRVQALARRLSIFRRTISRRFGERIIAISSELEQELVTLWDVDPGRIRRIFHGVDAAYFRTPTDAERADARAAFGLRETDGVACVIGRLHPVKRHDLLLQALAHLAQDGFSIIALFAGSGPIAREIETLASELGVADRVRMLGFVDARQVLWASDVLVLPSKREGFGLVVAEAMLCGVVPVRTPTAGVYDTIEDGVTGFVVPFDDPVALADRMRRLFEDESLRSQMAEAATQSARTHFTARRMVADTLDVYREAMRVRGHAR